MGDSQGIDQLVIGPALKAVAYGIDASLRAAGRAIGVVEKPAADGNPLSSVRIWFKAFIPQEMLSGPPGFDCFLGDNRGYSSDRNAPARMHSEVFLQDLHTPRPTMTQNHSCGLTRQVKCDSGQPVASARAPIDGMRFYNFRYPGAEV
ncbi:hypothetical protein [Microvirga sp. M2]|uniref:hypothetical protein n=1 Tax=Microvirga sp. M2 TaxID=3073270 RepID=UPI0039C12E88